MDKILTIQNQSKNTCHFYIVFQVLKVLLIKNCEKQSPDLLFLVVFISFYINRYRFSHIFRTSHTLSKKEVFLTNFLFWTDSYKAPHPLTGKICYPLQVFCWCSLIVVKKIIELVMYTQPETTINNILIV